MIRKLRILFLCTGNSCRSQMAEGWVRTLKSDVIDAFSAGIEARGLDLLAVKVMTEVGVDISKQTSKTVDQVLGIEFDYVITLCGDAVTTCPTWIGCGPVIRIGFDDPPELAKGTRTDAEALPHYRLVRDKIRAFVAGLPDNLAEHISHIR